MEIILGIIWYLIGLIGGLCLLKYEQEYVTWVDLVAGICFSVFGPFYIGMIWLMFNGENEIF